MEKKRFLAQKKALDSRNRQKNRSGGSVLQNKGRGRRVCDSFLLGIPDNIKDSGIILNKVRMWSKIKQ